MTEQAEEEKRCEFFENCLVKFVFLYAKGDVKYESVRDSYLGHCENDFEDCPCYRVIKHSMQDGRNTGLMTPEDWARIDDEQKWRDLMKKRMNR